MIKSDEYYGYVMDLPQTIPGQFQVAKINEWAAAKGVNVIKIYTEKSQNLELKASLESRSTLKSVLHLLEEGSTIVVYDFTIIYPADCHLPDFLKLLKDNNMTVYSACRDSDIFSYKEEGELRLKKFVPEGIDMPVEIDYTPSNIAYGYVRVSTDIQVTDGISLEAQEKEIRIKAASLNLVIVEIYRDEGKTGTNIERVGLQNVLSRLSSGQVLLTCSLSRISRNTRDCLNIVHDISGAGARLICISDNIDTSNPRSREAIAFQAFVAEQEVEMIKERVRSSMKLLKDGGRHVGRIPYGYRLKEGKGSGLKEDPDEQVIITKIKELVDNEQMSYSAIARKFQDEAVRFPGKSSKWVAATISRIYNRGPVAMKGRDNN